MTARSKITYEPEADVLSWEISSKQPIDHAREVGNVVIHFTSTHIPVFIEILNASSFVAEAGRLVTTQRPTKKGATI